MLRRGSGPGQPLELSPQELTRDLLRRHQGLGRGLWIAVGATSLLFLIGILGLALRLLGGFQDRAAWGYYAAIFAYLLTTTQAAPLVSMGLLLAKAHLRRPFSRSAELFTAAGPLVFLLFLPFLALIPPVQGRNTLWFGWPVGAPYVWDTLALGFLVLSGLAFLWATSRPDLAAMKHLGHGRLARLAAALAPHWRGDRGQWRTLRTAMVLLGSLYFAALVFTQTLLSMDLAMSLVPGWRSAIFPAYQVLTTLQGGVATTIVAMALWRRAGYRPYLALEHFWGLGKLLLALSLLGIYFLWAEFLTFWYGRIPSEQALLQLFMVGPNLPLFLAEFFLSFLGPLLALIWNPVRKSILGPSLVASGVLVGLFLDRIRIYVTAFAASQVGALPTEQIASARLPDGADIMMMIGLPAGAILLYLLASRLAPSISLWEMKEGLLLRITRRYLRRETVSLGKPE